ncbi:MAG: sigma 54-interacting transcriptional regulator [Deltaproteobacteria bacterium]|nr:sigma 54-interacting transcriptional regulator [Deltaproteobacteria bacterium]
MANSTVSRIDRGQAAPASPQFGLIVVRYANAALEGVSHAVSKQLSLGRGGGETVDIALTQDERASRRHAVLTRQGDAVVVEDAGSKNGTFVNGAKVQRSTLRAHDVLRIGDTLFIWTQLPEGPPATSGELIGRSATLTSLLSALDALARTELPVLLIGETGSGKELLARRLHAQSERKGQLVPVNVSAIPETLFESYMFGHVKGAFTGASTDASGAFEQARDGTLFLDEVGEMPQSQQAKLLRVLETLDFTPVGARKAEKSNARIVAATNAAIDLPGAKHFRRDLFARLSAGLLHVPPLRARKEDIPLIAAALMPPNEVLTVDDLERLLCFDWPLNVRELRSVLQRFALGTPISTLLTSCTPETTTPAIANQAADTPIGRVKRRSPSPPMSKEAFVAALEQSKGNVVALAKALDADRKQIYRWLKRFSLSPESFRK